jgi:hypothetical protein
MTTKTWMYKLDPRDRRSVVVQARTKGEARAQVKAELGIRPKDRLPPGCSVHAIEASRESQRPVQRRVHR